MEPYGSQLSIEVPDNDAEDVELDVCTPRLTVGMQVSDFRI